MATLRTNLSQAPKQKISQTMRSWLPLLQAGLEELEEHLEPFKENNPFLEIKPAKEKQEGFFKKKSFFEQATQNSVTDTIEALTLSKKSLYDVLSEQIKAPLFPTSKSQKIALKIIEYIGCEGYFEFESSILDELKCKRDELEKIRKRFASLEPVGVGAVDFKESFLFQLENIETDDECYEMAVKLINDFENIQKYTKSPHFSKSLEVIKTFRNPPAIDFLDDVVPIIPDIFVYQDGANLEVKINDAFYPELIIETEGLDENENYVSQKIKEGKDLVDALEMRKSTLYKIGLAIVEHQYDFFLDGVLKPMRLKDLAYEIGRNPSTISRAIAGKYLSCQRGLMPLKDFFSTAIDEETSNSSIKEYISENISYENHLKPLSDAKLLKMVENKFGVNLSRRTITKYRKQLNIASSSERKKIYKLQD